MLEVRLEEAARLLAELPFSATPEHVAEKALELAALKPGERLVDLGCGEGDVLVVAAGRFGAYAVGVELNPVLALRAAERVRRAGLGGSVDIVVGDLYSFDCSRFDVVFCYPSPTASRRLSLKLLSECKPGCRVVVHGSPLEGLRPSEVLEVPGFKGRTRKVYLYLAGR
uniref:Methyltransferase domain-containing protein n=1 Tax=Thermofilum pendens TaxID=2269 RepID=A0A7J3X6X0_THEPE